MVDAKLGTQGFIYNFWADAMKIQRSYCNRSPSFYGVTLGQQSKQESVGVCVQ